jgi:hypothetical protein
VWRSIVGATCWGTSAVIRLGRLQMRGIELTTNVDGHWGGRILEVFEAAFHVAKRRIEGGFGIGLVVGVVHGHVSGRHNAGSSDKKEG